MDLVVTHRRRRRSPKRLRPPTRCPGRRPRGVVVRVVRVFGQQTLRTLRCWFPGRGVCVIVAVFENVAHEVRGEHDGKARFQVVTYMI